MVTAVVDHDGEADGDVSLRYDCISLFAKLKSDPHSIPIPIQIVHSTSTTTVICQYKTIQS